MFNKTKPAAKPLRSEEPIPPLPDLPGQLSPLTVHASKRYPSMVTLPVR